MSASWENQRTNAKVGSFIMFLRMGRVAQAFAVFFSLGYHALMIPLVVFILE
jgi:hypothetical protein